MVWQESSVKIFATVMSDIDCIELFDMADKEMIEEKIGEALGLEKGQLKKR